MEEGPPPEVPLFTCGKSYNSKSNLNSHENAAHRGKVQVCPKCGKPFGHYSCYYAHIRSVCLDEDHPTLECHFCVDVDPAKKQVYKGLANLNAHIRRIHTKDALERNFVCQICCRRFKSSWTLKNHVKKHEDQPRQYICRVGCGADFADKRHWQQHNSNCKGPGSRVLVRKGDRLSELTPEEAKRRWDRHKIKAQQIKTDANDDLGIHATVDKVMS